MLHRTVDDIIASVKDSPPGKLKNLKVIRQAADLKSCQVTGTVSNLFSFAILCRETSGYIRLIRINIFEVDEKVQLERALAYYHNR